MFGAPSSNGAAAGANSETRLRRLSDAFARLVGWRKASRNGLSTTFGCCCAATTRCQHGGFSSRRAHADKQLKTSIIVAHLQHDSAAALARQRFQQ
jgi:hypothetical protein